MGQSRELGRITLRIAPDSAAFVVLLGLLAALPALSIDICAPALPLLPDALGTSTTVAGLTVSLFMAGFALGQLCGGRLSDRHGRRPVLLAGLACYTLAAVGCVFAASGSSLVSFRFLQGLAAGSCAVLPLAMVQDLFEGDAARAKRSYVSAVLGAAPVLAPALGSLLCAAAGWRSVYVALTLAGGLLLFIAIPGVTESRSGGSGAVAARYGHTTLQPQRDPRFIGFALANAFSYAAIFAYIAGAPLVIIGTLRLSPAIFSAIFAATALALTAGAWASGRLGRRGVGAPVLLNSGLAIATAAALALAAISLAGTAWSALMLAPLLLLLFSRGAIAPNLQHLAIERRREQAGAASAAVGVSQLGSGAIASAAVAFLLPYYGAAAVAVPMALLAAAALFVWYWTGRLRRDPEPVPRALPT